MKCQNTGIMKVLVFAIKLKKKKKKMHWQFSPFNDFMQTHCNSISSNNNDMLLNHNVKLHNNPVELKRVLERI